jgi:hypothetical protein
LRGRAVSGRVAGQSLCERVELLTPYILARSGPLIVAAAAPGPGAPEGVREALCTLLLGGRPRERGLTLVKALALFYGGLTLYYQDNDGGITLLSRILPSLGVSVEGRRACSPPVYSIEGLLRLWARASTDSKEAIEALGSCTLDPPGYTLRPGGGEPLPPTGVVLH